MGRKKQKNDIEKDCLINKYGNNTLQHLIEDEINHPEKIAVYFSKEYITLEMLKEKYKGLNVEFIPVDESAYEAVKNHPGECGILETTPLIHLKEIGDCKFDPESIQPMECSFSFPGIKDKLCESCKHFTPSKYFPELERYRCGCTKQRVYAHFKCSNNKYERKKI